MDFALCPLLSRAFLYYCDTHIYGKCSRDVALDTGLLHQITDFELLVCFVATPEVVDERPMVFRKDTGRRHIAHFMMCDVSSIVAPSHEVCVHKLLTLRSLASAIVLVCILPLDPSLWQHNLGEGDEHIDVV